MAGLRRTALVLVVATIPFASSAVIAAEFELKKTEAWKKIRNLRIADAKIRKAAAVAASRVDQCDPVAARRDIRSLQGMQAKLLVRINTGAAVSDTERQDFKNRKIELALNFLQQHLQRHCGNRRVSNRTLGRSYGFFVPATQQFAQRQLNLALAAAKACERQGYNMAVERLKAAADKSRIASKTNAKFRDQYEGDAVSLGELARDLQLKDVRFLKHCMKLGSAEKPKAPARRYFWYSANVVADWAGRDTDCTEGAKPIGSLCRSDKLGTVAVCWMNRPTGHPFPKCKGFGTWCTYKSVKLSTVPDARAYGTVYVCREPRKSPKPSK